MTKTPHRYGDLVEAVDYWLPQTQCTQCGYPRCWDYAEAIVSQNENINRCPPGGDITIRGLAELLDRQIVPLDESCGDHKTKALAKVDEATCIGCALCLDACPVDAIIGAKKLMHTVISSECTGCELCLPPCPVDCIELIPDKTKHIDSVWPEYSHEQTELARKRNQAKLRRNIVLEKNKTLGKLHRRAHPKNSATKQEILSAVERVRAKRQQSKRA